MSHRIAGAARLAGLLLIALAFGTPAVAQSTGADSPGGAHFILGGFYGRFDPDGAGRTDLVGAEAGLGYRELLQLTGFYWRGLDGAFEGLTDDQAWGGELQLGLNAGVGLSPFIAGGLARVRFGGVERTAATAGAGLVLPLGPVLLHAGARDYMFGISGLAGDQEPDEITHNWLGTVGVKLALGARRPTRMARPIGVAEAPEAAALAALRDSLRLAQATMPPDSMALPRDSTLALAVVDTVPGLKNYQSNRRIEIPIPTEGSITLRYGPEPAVNAAPPVVVNVPGTAAAPDAVVPPPVAGALTDEATRSWLQQLVAAQVTNQLAQRPAAEPTLTQAQLDRIAQRVIDGLNVSLPPRTLPEGAAVVVPPPAAPSPAAAAPVAPVESAARVEPVTPVEHVAAAARLALAAAAAAHPRLLGVAETDRGPAAVVGDAAFESGAALVTPPARAAIDAVADVVRETQDRFIYVQGHTDGTGDEVANQRLSELRAEAVRSLLVQAGAQPDRVVAIGYGQGRPVAGNDTERGRALNRRVEIVIGLSPASSR